MTTAVKIEVPSTEQRGIGVTTLVYEKGQAGERELQRQYVKPGQAVMFYVHQLQDLRIDELLT